MYAPVLGNNILARFQVEMKRVGNEDLGAGIDDFFAGQGFNDGLSGDRNEGRGGYFAV